MAGILFLVAFSLTLVLITTTVFSGDIYKLYLYKKFPKEIPFEQFKYLDRESYVELTTVSGQIYIMDLKDYEKEYDNGSEFIYAEGALINKNKIESVTKYHKGNVAWNGNKMKYQIIGSSTIIYRKNDDLLSVNIYYDVVDGIAYRR